MVPSEDFPLLAEVVQIWQNCLLSEASRFARPNGMIALFTPSGIAADKGASEFFASITSPQAMDLLGDERTRLAALYDLKIVATPAEATFPGVDGFKFCAFIFGGSQRRFNAARCAFFLHSLTELRNPDRVPNSAADFTREPKYRRRADLPVPARR